MVTLPIYAFVLAADAAVEDAFNVSVRLSALTAAYWFDVSVTESVPPLIFRPV
jgi:hypothetical protein